MLFSVCAEDTSPTTFDDNQDDTLVIITDNTPEDGVPNNDNPADDTVEGFTPKPDTIQPADDGTPYTVTLTTPEGGEPVTVMDITTSTPLDNVATVVITVDDGTPVEVVRQM